MKMKIKIRDGLEIGDGCPTFVIAEIGSNWHSLDDCLESIQLAKQAGADAVKFQLFDTVALYGPVPRDSEWYKSLPVHKPGTTNYNGVLPNEWLPRLKQECDKHSIEFMCSAFSPELYDAVNPFVNIHKLASSELTHVRILEKLKSYGKPIILSSGGHTTGDIAQVLHFLGDTSKVVLMYCVSEYPAREVDLDKIIEFRDMFGCLSGFSDHTIDAQIIPVLASRMGDVIEKHVNFVGAKGPDADYALTGSQFKRMVQRIRGKSAIIPQELSMILRHNRRIVAISDIKLGDTLKEGINFGIFRSLKDDTRAFSPFAVDAINGLKVTRDIAAGDGIGPGDV